MLEIQEILKRLKIQERQETKERQEVARKTGNDREI